MKKGPFILTSMSEHREYHFSGLTINYFTKLAEKVPASVLIDHIALFIEVDCSEEDDFDSEKFEQLVQRVIKEITRKPRC